MYLRASKFSFLYNMLKKFNLNLSNSWRKKIILSLLCWEKDCKNNFFFGQNFSLENSYFDTHEKRHPHESVVRRQSSIKIPTVRRSNSYDTLFKKKGFCSIKSSSEMLQYLPHFWNTKKPLKMLYYMLGFFLLEFSCS